MWTQVGDETGRVSEVDVRTMDYIMQRYKFERTAVYFLQEAVKLEKQSLKVKAKQAAKAAGMSPRRSPAKAPKGSPKAKAARSKEEPFTAILRITEEINTATSLTQVKRLQKQLEHLSPMKAPEPGDSEALTPAKLSAPPRKGRGPAKAEAEKPASVSLQKSESKKLAPRKAKKAEDKGADGDVVAVRKRPAMVETAAQEPPATPSRKGGKLKLAMKTLTRQPSDTLAGKRLTRKTSDVGSDKGEKEAQMKKPAAAKRSRGKDKAADLPTMKKRPAAAALDDAINAD